MTREDAIRELKCYHRNDGTVPEELKMAISALEQEPCEKCEVGNPCLYCKHEFSQIEPCDAISREAVDNAINEHFFGIQFFDETGYDIYREVMSVIEKLPSVTPSHKGHWIDVDAVWCKCSECDAYRQMNLGYKEYYCPNCGAEMESEE